ncbi:fad binding domain-containing protein [Rutstroemia sp. NJR-2017a BBW]|nr:fad binding domain-containing protein [Rutstroemia sp. NJR-2017a BBW]
MRSTSVLIVGAGPTGLTLALELSVQNIPFILIDALPTPAPHSRALILHCRSVELLSRHPLVVSTILPLCKQNLGISIYVNKKKAFEMDLKKEGFGALDTEFNGPYFISQNVTESILEKQLVEYGGKLERGVKATSIVQDSEGVTVMTRKVREDSYEEPGEEEIRCKYIVGCDGAHSAVRKSTGLKFEGGAYAQDFLLADVSMKWNYATDRMTMLMCNEFMMCLPLMDGKYRLVLSQPSSKDGVAVEDEPTLQDFRNAFSRLAEGEVKIEDPPIWMSRFKLHHRTVEAYRKDRVFVAGDAAHIHSPAGGQGMNTGIQDAINLGWKLGMVLRNEKPDSFLDAYSIERHRVGPTHHLVLFSGLGKNSLDSEELLETVGTDFPEKNENWLRIHRVASLMRRQEGDLCDHEGILHERYGFVEQPGYVLIRPDLYIGYIGTMQGLGEWKASLLV